MIKQVAQLLFMMSFVLLLIACGREDILEKHLQKPVPVKTFKATMQPLSSQSTYSGSVEPIERVRLSTKITGWIEKIYFEEGERVQKGSVLVKLRSQDLEANQAQAAAAISEADAHFKNEQMNLQRIESLYQKEAATQKELDDMRAAFASALAKKKTAQEMKKEVDELFKYATLSAPFDGVVTRKMLGEGDLANPGQLVLEVENMGKVKIVAKVSESEVATLEVGMPVTVLVQASNFGTNGNHPTLSIDKIIPAADPASRQFDVHVLVDNSEGLLKSGMFARIATGKSQEMALVVPKTAIFHRGQLEGVFVVDSESIGRLRWIRTGAVHNDLIEVLTGLNSGEQVVIEGALKLLDGQSVEVIE